MTRLRDKFRERRASVALMFAMFLLAFMGTVALAIDFGNITLVQAELDAAADSAALKATSAATIAYSANNAANAAAVGQGAGAQFFNAEIGQIANATIQPPAVNVIETSGTFTATVSYQASVNTIFARVLGIDSIAVVGSSAASATAPSYLSIAFLLDTSSSMLIAATAQDMAALAAAVEQPQYSVIYQAQGQSQACAFACHFSNNPGLVSGGATIPGYTNDFFGIARYNNITLRLDVLLSAVQNVIQQIQNMNIASQTQVALYAFDTAFRTILAPTNNMSTAFAQAATVESPANLPLTPVGVGETNFPDAMTALTQITPASGDGGSTATAGQFVFLVTDGVADYTDSSGQRTLGVMDPSYCTALKSRGVTILVLYTTYIPIPTNAYYNDNVAPLLPAADAPAGTSSAVTDSLTSCASQPSYFFTATSSAEINAALSAMLQIAVASPGRFTR